MDQTRGYTESQYTYYRAPVTQMKVFGRPGHWLMQVKSGKAIHIMKPVL